MHAMDMEMSSSKYATSPSARSPPAPPLPPGVLGMTRSHCQQPRSGWWSGLSSTHRTLVYLLLSLLAAGVVIGAVLGTLLAHKSSSSSSDAADGAAGAGSNAGAGGGTGTLPVRPTGNNFDASAPVTMSIVDFSAGSTTAGVTRGSVTFDLPAPDLTFDHPWLDSSIGSISIVHSSGSVRWGEFEFGATLIAHPPSLNAVNKSVPVYQVLVAAKPFGRWAGYPARRHWNSSTDVTHPPPFKVLLRDAAGALLGAIQMADGLPINDPSLSQVRADHVPLRPLWHCGQMLKWQSAYTAPNVNMRRWMGGITTESIRSTQAKQSYSTNPADCMLGSGSGMRVQENGLAQWHAMPRHPLGTTTTAYDYTFDPNNDADLYDYVNTYPPRLNSSAKTNTHTQLEGGGVNDDHDAAGVRRARSHVPSSVAVVVACVCLFWSPLFTLRLFFLSLLPVFMDFIMSPVNPAATIT